MSRATAESQPDDKLKNLDVVGWRYERLREAGYSPDEAVVLAEAGLVDLHAACDLLLHGCSGELAVRILL